MKIYPTHEQIVNSAAVFFNTIFSDFSRRTSFQGEACLSFWGFTQFPATEKVRENAFYEGLRQSRAHPPLAEAICHLGYPYFVFELLLRGAHCHSDDWFNFARCVIHAIVYDVALHDVLGYRDGNVSSYGKPLRGAVGTVLRGNQSHVDPLLREEGMGEMFNVLRGEVVTLQACKTPYQSLEIRWTLGCVFYGSSTL